MDADPVRIAAQGQLTMSDSAWEQARSRAAVIGSLAARGATGIAAADRAAAELGVSRRQVCVLLGRYRQGSGLVTDLRVTFMIRNKWWGFRSAVGEAQKLCRLCSKCPANLGVKEVPLSLDEGVTGSLRPTG